MRRQASSSSQRTQIFIANKVAWIGFGAIVDVDRLTRKIVNQISAAGVGAEHFSANLIRAERLREIVVVRLEPQPDAIPSRHEHGSSVYQGDSQEWRSRRNDDFNKRRSAEMKSRIGTGFNGLRPFCRRPAI